MTLNPSVNTNYLSNNEYEIYSRHISLDEIGINGQKRLKQASVLFIGAGGLASSAIIYLASCGIGSIGIIDNDHVTQSNLNRQILYNSYDINKLKVLCAKKQINILNSLCKVEIYPYKLNKNNAIHLIKKYDIVLDTNDSFNARYIVNHICYKLHKIHIYGAIQRFEGQVSVFNYKNGVKYSDLYPKYLNLQQNTCEDVGVLGILPGIIGLIQATETIKIITGVGQILSGYLLIYNALTLEFKKVKIQPRTIVSDPIFNNYTKLKLSKYISKKTLQNKINNNKNQNLLIDVRQHLEYQKQHIPSAINIPIKLIVNMNKIPAIKKHSLNKTIIIYCSDNSRSIIASRILEQHKIIHYILKDGIKNL